MVRLYRRFYQVSERLSVVRNSSAKSQVEEVSERLVLYNETRVRSVLLKETRARVDEVSVAQGVDR